ncbi:MAG: hypothetical protein FWC92_01305 [Defluviitaleaceae bacterium]|nr:hypothetical protein [Defluviitaleaceae bacterium]
MKNWRRILVTGMVAGMIAVTGCSSNLPETNQGNRNGQRVVDAVNRRTDSYGLTRTHNTNERTVRGFNRGFRRATRNDVTARTRSSNHVARPGAGLTNNHNNTGLPTHRTPNRSAGTINRGRVGHTFGYDNPGLYTNSVDGEYGGYDLGMRNRLDTPTENAANLNNRVVRSTPTRNTTTKKRATSTGITRSTNAAKNTATKAARPTRKAPRTSVSAAQPMLHNNVNTGAVNRATTTRSATNRQAARTPSARTERVRELRQNVLNNRSNTSITPAAPIMNANTVVNPNATRGIDRTRGINRAGRDNQNRSIARTAERSVGINNTSRLTRPDNVNINDFNLTHRGLNNSMYLGPDFYMSNDDVNGVYGGLPYAEYSRSLGPSIAANASDDSNSLAIFKKNKATDDAAPTTPAPTNSPQAPTPNRFNSINRTQPIPTPAPATSPVPTSLAADWDYDDNVGDYDYNANFNNIHDLNDTDTFDGDYTNIGIVPSSDTNTLYMTPPSVTGTQRLMK